MTLAGAPRVNTRRERKAHGRREKTRPKAAAQKKAIARARPSSDSHAALLAHPASTREIARELGLSVSTVVDWRNGSKVPTPPRRRALEAAFGISAGGWTTRGGPPAPAAAPPAAPAPATTAEILDELLAQLDAARRTPNLSPRELAGISDQILKVTAKREAQLDEAERAALLEARILREHPAWKRVRRALERVFERLPEGLRGELEAELSRAEAG